MKISTGIYNRAFKLAEESSYYPFKIAAIVFKNGRILSEGINKIGNSRRIDKKYKFLQHSIHAEAEALSKLDKEKTKGASVFIIRINGGTKKVSEAKPCIFCQKMLFDYGIKNVFSTSSNGQISKYKIIDKGQDSTNEKCEKKDNDYSDNFLLRSW